MNYRELLELAAKAYGYNTFSGHAEQLVDSGWNPLTDDGDALRLAHKLGLLSDVLVWPRTIEGTRRVIVHAAAEIGKGMK